MLVRDLPTVLHHWFWELDLTELRELPDGLVMARLMERGGVEETRWLLQRFGVPRLASWFAASPGAGLSPRTRALWACVLRCPAPPARPQIPWSA